MRERSGRSGRRRGSQKPGTAWGAASTFCGTGVGVAWAGGFGAAGACACAVALTSASMVAAARQAVSGLVMGNRAVRNGSGQGFWDMEGLIDHPPQDASGVSALMVAAGQRYRFKSAAASSGLRL